MMPRFWTMVPTAVLFSTGLAGCGSTDGPGGSTPVPVEPTLFANTGPSPTQPIVHGGIDWSETGETPIRSRPIAGGATTTLAYRMGAPAALAVRGPDVDRIDEQNGISPSGCGGFGQTVLLRTPRRARPPPPWNGQDSCASLAPQLVVAGAARAYWVTATANNAQVLRRTPLGRRFGNRGELVRQDYDARRCQQSLLDGKRSSPWRTGHRSLPLAGGAPVTIASGFASRTGVFALSATSVVYA